MTTSTAQKTATADEGVAEQPGFWKRVFHPSGP
jgi:hypothetical protein